MYVITRLTPLCVDGVISAVPHENELLLSPNTEFVVTKLQHKPSMGPLRGCNVIEMQQIPDDTLWS